MDPRKLARNTDPDTSHAAAHELSERAASMRIRLATVFQEEGPMIADDAIEEAGFGPEDGAWKRISDLLNEGILWDTGYRLRGRSGRLQRVLAYTDKEVT